MPVYKIWCLEDGEYWFPNGVEKDYRWMHSEKGAQEEIDTHYKFLRPVNGRPKHPMISLAFVVVLNK